jgi:hypothetical protein
MDFETYLRNKKIDPVIFEKEEPMLWYEFKMVYEQVHPDSFTAQKLFLINGIRRKYPLQQEASESKTGDMDEKAVKPKPKMPVQSSASEKAKPRMMPKVKISPKIKKKE